MRVLIIEDDEAILDFLQRALSAAGYTVDVSTTGIRAAGLSAETLWKAASSNAGKALEDEGDWTRVAPSIREEVDGG